MANAKKDDKPKKPDVIIRCNGCDEDRKVSDFYKSYGATASGLLPYCKYCCIHKGLDSNGQVNLDKFKSMLMQVDRPFLYQTFYDNMKKYPKVETAIGFYFKDLGMVQNRKMRYSDSIFEPQDKDVIEDLDNVSESLNPQLSNKEKKRLIDKWGLGYSDDELYSFEKKYDLLKNNYPERTAMHTEALLTYIRYRVKEELATAKGDVAEAQKWGQLADKASERAKINPSQLSKADLSGGLSGFGELSRAVEQAVDIVPILPKFKEKPQDKVDFTIWCYVNYIRRLRNMPDAEYQDIYHFYEERKKEYSRNPNRDFELEE